VLPAVAQAGDVVSAVVEEAATVAAGPRCPEEAATPLQEEAVAARAAEVALSRAVAVVRVVVARVAGREAVASASPGAVIA
jgi:hypothetical protein